MAAAPTTAPNSTQVQHATHRDTPATSASVVSTSKPSILEAPQPGNATNIERRTDLSLLYRLLRSLIRPLRPRLVSFNKTWPEGSPRLSKRPSSHYGVRITERKLQVASSPEHPLPQADPASNAQDLWLYDFDVPRSQNDMLGAGAKKEIRKTIYYFAGGGFQAPASGEHWKLCARLAKELSVEGTSVVLVSYPLSPNSPAKDSLPLLRAWLRLALNAANENSRANESVILMGDSAGGNVVISLAFWWAEQLAGLKRQLEGKDMKLEVARASELESLQRLRTVIVMSPPCDFRNINEQIEEADRSDPVLTRDLTNGAAAVWVKDWPANDGKDPKGDPTLSPNLQTPEAWKMLRESALSMHGTFGTADVLSPDCEVFMQRCQKEAINGIWLVWEGQMHCFPLTVCYGLMEGKEGFQWLCRRVRNS